jgi:WD40 repeat protein/SAM-dependent methyltransferase
MPEKWKEELWRYPCGESVIGVGISPDAERIVAGSVDKHLYFLDQTGRVLWKKELDHPAWNVAISDDGRLIGVCTASKSLWEGSAYLFTPEGQNVWKRKIRGPLWSISINTGGLLVLGCWDNNLYIFKKEHDQWKQWSRSRLPESRKGIFGTAVSEDGNTIVAGSLDGLIYILRREARRTERVLSEAGIYGIATSSKGELIAAGLDDGCVLYCDRSGKNASKYKVAQAEVCGVSMTPTGNLMVAGSFDHHIYLLNHNDILWQHRVDDRVWGVSISKSGEFVVAGGDDGNIYFLRNLCLEGSLDLLNTKLNELKSKNDGFGTVAPVNMIGARFYLENNLLHKALKEAERAYELSPDDEATTSLLSEICERRLNLNPEDYETHFKLGLLYKKKKRFEEATKQFSLSSSDSRLTDKALALIQECASSNILRDSTLIYDDITYIKYEHPSLEDEIKKNIEMFHALTEIRSLPNVHRTLDIGCGTGRYPFALMYQGHDATGIDVSPEAIKKCNMTKELEETRWGKLGVRFLCMDGRKTLFEDSTFDLVTCMMGTFAHFTFGEKRVLLLEMRRILKPNGYVVISTWNPRYANAKYLGFYRKRDRETLRQNLITDTELKNLLMEVGFSDVEITQFAFLPDEFYYELDLDNLHKECFQKILLIESLISKSFLALEGQMYLLHAQKRDTEEKSEEWRC